MKKRDFLLALLVIPPGLFLHVVYTTPGAVQITPGADNILYVDQEGADGLQSNGPGLHTAPEPGDTTVTITATKTDTLVVDNDGDGEADAGDVISYNVAIQNSGDTAAEDVVVADTIDLNTTLVSGSLSVSPIARNDSFATTGNISITVSDGAGDVLDNDDDPDGGALTGVTAVQGSDGNIGVATETTAIGLGSVTGFVTMQADGSFSYEPPPGFVGTDTFTYTVTDDEDQTDTATVSIAISDMVWFVDNSSGGSNQGTFSNPFTSITSFNDAQGASPPNATDGNVIFVYQGSGNYTDGLELRDNQTLLGQGVDLLIELDNLGISQSPFSNLNTSPPSGPGNRPTLTDGSGNGIDLASDNTIKGLSVGNTGGFGIDGESFGTLHVDDVSITGTGPGLRLDAGTVTGPGFTAISATAGPHGIYLQNVAGTVNLGGGNIAGSFSTAALEVNGGIADVAYDGTLQANSSALPVLVRNKTGGTVELTGAVNNVGPGVRLFDNTGATVRFAGGMDIVGGNDHAFEATGGGTVEVCDDNPCDPNAAGSLVNSLTASDAHALRVVDTDIGSNRLEFRSISSSTGNTTGIVLDNTGTAGGLTVTGNGTAGSGGTISDKGGANGQTDAGIGIYLNQTAAVRLNWMQLNDFSNFAVRGVDVDGFELTDSVISGSNGDNAGEDEGSLNFVNLLDSAAITRADISGGLEDNLRLVNNTGTLDRLTISGSTFHNNSNDLGNDGILLESQSSAVMRITVDNTTFSAHRGDHFDGNAVDSSTLDVIFTDNTMTGGHPNALGQTFILSNGASADVTFDVSGNSINGAILSAFTFFQSASSNASSSLMGTFSGNTIGSTGVAGSGSAQGNGVIFNATGDGTMTVLADGNTIRQWSSGHGFEVSAGDESPVVDVTITDNLITEPDNTAFPINGLHLNAGTTSAGIAQVCLDARDNDILNSGSTFDDDFRLRQRNSSTVNLPGYGGDSDDTDAVIAFVQGNNIGTPSGSAAVSGSGFTGDGSACALPEVAVSSEGSGLPPENLSKSELAGVKTEALQHRSQEDVTAQVANITNQSSTSRTRATTVRTTPVYRVSAELMALTIPIELSASNAPVSGNVQLSAGESEAEGGTTDVDSAEAASPLFSGENINLNLSTLDPGQEVTIEFQATIDDPLPSGVDRVQNQAVVSGSNFSDVLSLDPDPNPDFPPVSGETITPLAISALRPDSTGGWRLLAVPGAGLIVDSLAALNLVQGVDGSYPGVAPNLYVDFIGPDNVGGYAAAESIEDTLPPGRGFFWYLFDEDEFGGGTPPPEWVALEDFLFPAALGAALEDDVAVEFESIPDTTGSGLLPAYMVGNPFQVAFQLSGIAVDEGTLHTNFFAWDPGDSTYVTLDTDSFVSVWQGFWAEVESGTAPPTFTFAAASRDSTQNPPIIGLRAADESFALNLTLRGALDGGKEVVDRAVRIRFEEDAMLAWDRHDGSKFYPPFSTDGYALLSLEGTRNDEPYRQAVRSLPSGLDEQVTAPVAFRATESGEFTISATPENLPEGWHMMLRDLVTEEEIDLLEESHSFSGKARDEWQDRFEIVITPEGVVDAEDGPVEVRLSNPVPNPAVGTTTLVLQVPEPQHVTARVYDTIGRLIMTVYDSDMAAGEEVHLAVDVSRLAAGAYVIRVRGETFAESRRFAIVR